MKYSYEYKRMCVDLYRQGKWPETPAGIEEKAFHSMVRIWVRQEEACGTDSLQHKNQNRNWTTEEKYEYVAKILAGESYKKLAISAGISSGDREDSIPLLWTFPEWCGILIPHCNSIRECTEQREEDLL